MHALTLGLCALLAIFPACSSNSTTHVVGTANTGGTAGDAGTDGSTGMGGSSSVSTSLELTCRNYCTTIQASCVSGNNIQFKSDLSCMNSCPAFAPGNINDSSINSLGCRLQHAQAAASNPDQNCAAAGPTGGGVCGNNCNAYCSIMLTICPTVYEDQATCESACSSMTGVNDFSYHTPSSGDNLQCRVYHATFAAEGSPDIHCVHAAPIPASPCADD